MSELKHTPGPWEAAKYPEGHYGIFEKNYPFQIAEVLNRKCSDEMVEANARMIAAAPKLLSACLMGDILGNNGPFLLRHVAELIERFAPASASELRRKADAEEEAITEAVGKEGA